MHMAGNKYYAQKLSAERLRRVYEIATPRVRRYFEAEIEHVLSRITPGDRVIELGCGYGRVLECLAAKAGQTVGIDNSLASLRMARDTLGRSCLLFAMDAAALGFADGVFDLVACIQNGISAFKVEQLALMREALRVTRPGGHVLFSSYSERFWDDRLEWFEMQAAEGLLGEIDHERTREGVIVCKDGFRATTVGPDDFAALAAQLGYKAIIEEVDGSSVFCEIVCKGVRP
jgi:ubiquinone/menaquinone biosynthesis C-methylase UbiE